MPRVRLDILRIESQARPDTEGDIITDQFKCVYCLGTGLVASSRAYKVRLVLGLLLAWLFVAIFYDLYSRALAPGHPDDRLAAKLLARRTDVAGLRGSITTTEQLDQVWKKHFPELPSWRSTAKDPDHPFFSKMGDASREIRGEHMVRTLIDLVRKGERVMAVVGCSHVIRQEPMLRSALGAPAP